MGGGPAQRRSEGVSGEVLTAPWTVSTRGRANTLAVARQPLPVDPKLVELRNELQVVSRPVPEDTRLAQLRLDAAQSEKQMGNTRLTAAQDLAWALINSPAFLFNH